MAEPIKTTEVEGVRYVVVRLREIEKLNQQITRFLDALESLTFLESYEIEDIRDFVESAFEDHVRKIIRWKFDVSVVCFDAGSPSRCEAYAFSEESGSITFSPEVYVREDKYKR